METVPQPTPFPEGLLRRNPVWPSVARMVTVTHYDGSETTSVMRVVYEPDTPPPGRDVRQICIRACRKCAAEPEQ